MSTLKTIRCVIFVGLTLCSLTVLGIITYFITSYYRSPLLLLGLITSALTVITVNTVLVIDRKRKGAVVSRVWFELLWTGVIWVLWLASAAYMSSLMVFINCSQTWSFFVTDCRLDQVHFALNWINWVMAFGWFITLLTLSIKSQSRGNSQIWHTATVDAPFFGPAKASSNLPPSTHIVYQGNIANPGYQTTTVPPMGQPSLAPQQFVLYGAPQQHQAGPQTFPNTQQHPGSPSTSRSAVSYVRSTVLAALMLSSLIVMIISAYFRSWYGGVVGRLYALDINVSVFTLIAATMALFRKKAVTSHVRFELLWSGLLCAFWLGTTAYRTHWEYWHYFAVDCISFYKTMARDAQVRCHAKKAMGVLSWISWILILGWFVTLLTLSLKSRSRGYRQVWDTPAYKVPFTEPGMMSANQPFVGVPYPAGTIVSPGVPYPTVPPPMHQAHPQMFVVYGYPQPYQGAPQGYPQVVQPCSIVPPQQYPAVGQPLDNPQQPAIQQPPSPPGPPPQGQPQQVNPQPSG